MSIRYGMVVAHLPFNSTCGHERFQRIEEFFFVGNEISDVLIENIAEETASIGGRVGNNLFAPVGAGKTRGDFDDHLAKVREGKRWRRPCLKRILIRALPREAGNPDELLQLVNKLLH